MAANFLVNELADIEREISRVADDIEDWDEYDLRDGRDKMRTLATRVAVQVERIRLSGGAA